MDSVYQSARTLRLYQPQKLKEIHMNGINSDQIATMSKWVKILRKTAGDAASVCVANIASLLEDHHASISADLKANFAALEVRLNQTQAVVMEVYGEPGV